MTGFFCFIVAVLTISVVATGLMAKYAPKTFAAMQVDAERRRERRNEALKSIVTAAGRWLNR